MASGMVEGGIEIAGNVEERLCAGRLRTVEHVPVWADDYGP